MDSCFWGSCHVLSLPLIADSPPVSSPSLHSFSREIPTRFKKELLQPYLGSNGSVEVEDLNRLLTNIGHPNELLSSDEQRVLLQEAGSNNNCITMKKMMELLD